ncbi:hypothetical protein, partial [Bradyrhizobium sp.]|uniref:hypothetical protein n=1 Tax=Bradyrhizobium sp. TaxID=376 RepID=UPI0029165B12
TPVCAPVERCIDLARHDGAEPAHLSQVSGSARAGSRVSSPGDHPARDQRRGEIVRTRTPAPKQARALQLVHHPYYRRHMAMRQ